MFKRTSSVANKKTFLSGWSIHRMNEQCKPLEVQEEPPLTLLDEPKSLLAFKPSVLYFIVLEEALPCSEALQAYECFHCL